MTSAEASVPTPPTHEEAVRAVFESPGWRHVSIDQYGPDGTTKISAVYFSVCPVCSAIVPIAEGDSGEGLRSNHMEFHLLVARNADFIDKAPR